MELFLIQDVANGMTNIRYEFGWLAKFWLVLDISVAVISAWLT
jgi:hypothetical protein